MEQKDPVKIDEEYLKTFNIESIMNDYVKIEDGTLRHNVDKLALDIYTYLVR